MMRRDGLSVDEVEKALCSQAGLKGMSGGHNDIRDIQSEADAGDANARLALDVFVHSARHWIGAYFAELNGLDALVFTAGIGENRTGTRAEICANLDQLGIRLDLEMNEATQAEETVISAEDAPVKVMVIPTNEELVVAREEKRFLQYNQNSIFNQEKNETEIAYFGILNDYIGKKFGGCGASLVKAAKIIINSKNILFI